jgi:hypothetical protein
MHTRPTKRAPLVLAAFALLVASPLGAGEQLTIRVSPNVAFAPATLLVHAVAQPDAANRALQIQLVSLDYYRSSLIQLDGDQDAVTTMVRYEGVPGGMYEVRAMLLGSGGQKRATTARTVEILSNTGR